MKWISVKERLPANIEADHLVTDGKKVHCCTYTQWYHKQAEPYWNWLLPYGMKLVTHWMPLPECPKQDS